jgi:hypothetical protein
MRIYSEYTCAAKMNDKGTAWLCFTLCFFVRNLYRGTQGVQVFPVIPEKIRTFT